MRGNGGSTSELWQVDPRKPAKVLELSGAFAKNPARKGARAAELKIGTPLGPPPSEWVEKAEHSQRCKDLLDAWHQVIAQDVLGVLNASHRLLVESTCYLMHKIRQASKGLGKSNSGDFAQLNANMAKMGQTPADSARVAEAVRIPDRGGSTGRDRGRVDGASTLAKKTKQQLAAEIAKRKKWKGYSERSTQYCRDVVEGRIHACSWAVMACQRHLDDLARSRGKAWEYEYDVIKAGKACSFGEKFPHVKGKWARGGQLIHLSPGSASLSAASSGWVLRSTGMRRFTEADVFVPRKNGKTVIAAVIAIFMFIADGEPGAEVYTGAANRDQADEVFSPASKMIRRAEGFKEWFGITIGKLSMYVLDEGSKFEKVIGNPGDGPSPHCFIHDEFHEQPTFEQYETAKTGMMAREQPLQLVISTAGFDIESPCKELQDGLHKVLDGTLPNDRLFGITYTVDEPDKLVKDVDGKDVPYWTTTAALQEANPNFGVSVLEDRILADQDAAVQRASRQNSFKVKHLNLWVNGRDPWMDREAWRACADPSLAVEEFIHDPCVEGFDLGARVDLTSRCKVFTRMQGSAKHYYLFAKHYVPLAIANDGKHSAYERWIEEGKIIGHPGVEILLPEVQKEIEADLEIFNFDYLVFDPHQAMQMQQELRPQLGQDADGEDRLIDIPQTWKYLDPAMKEIEAAVLSKRLHHTGDPVLAWGIGNVMVKPDANENIFPRKENSASKIDPASALFNAMVRAMMDNGGGYTRPYAVAI